MVDKTGYNGQQSPGVGGDDWGAVAEVARRIMLEIRSTCPVIVRAVTNDGALAPAGFMDVQPMVNQIDGAGNQVPHGIIHNVPYLRMQGGTNAIIMDPVVGDIGICGFCSHDISVVKETRELSNPGSRRRFDYADGVYIGGMLNGVPEQYIRFSATGIEMVSPTLVRIAAPTIQMEAENTITMIAGDSISEEAPVVTVDASTAATITSPDITLDGDVTNTGDTQLDGALNVDGATTLKGVMSNGHNVGSTHVHTLVTPGLSNSGPPP